MARDALLKLRARDIVAGGKKPLLRPRLVADYVRHVLVGELDVEDDGYALLLHLVDKESDRCRRGLRLVRAAGPGRGVFEALGPGEVQKREAVGKDYRVPRTICDDLLEGGVELVRLAV